MITEEQKKKVLERVNRIRNKKYINRTVNIIDSIPINYYEEPNLEKYKAIKKYTEE